jgi:hypothetical protein
MIIFYLFMFLLLCIVLIIYIKYNKKEGFDTNNKLCCFYTYYEKDELYKNNFEYFLKNAILDKVDYYIIINGKSTVTINSKTNIKVLYRPNKGYDFGGYSYALKKLNNVYDYYFFMNTSVRGPYGVKDWTEPFIKLFNDDVKVVGTTINIYNVNNTLKPHVQSMFFCIPREYLQYLNTIDFFNEDFINNYTMQEVIDNKEVMLSTIALKHNWNINCLLDKYKGLDYRIIEADINPTSTDGDPYYKNGYFGKSIKKEEVIFFKNNRDL